MVSHWFTLLRAETDDPVLRTKFAAHRLESEADGWFVVYILYSECRCSQRILDHLATRGVLPGLHESVVLVDPHPVFET